MIAAFWRIFSIVLYLMVLVGCGNTDERLKKLGAKIEALDGQMKVGEVREVPLPQIKKGEWIVAINGQYAGNICEPSPLSKQITQKINYEYGMSESRASAFFVLIENGIKIDESMFEIRVLPSEESRWTCALIATSHYRSLTVECIKPTSGKPKSHACEVVLRAVK